MPQTPSKKPRNIGRERSLAAYQSFFDHYDALIGLLCLGAHEGLKPENEVEFRELKGWFRQNYPPLKPSITPFLVEDESDLVPTASRERRACDAFEALFMPDSVSTLLETDQGSLIGRMIRTQQALESWSRSLHSE